MISTSSRLFLRFFTAISMAICIIAFYQTYNQIDALDIVIWRSKWVILIAGYAVNFLFGIWLLSGPLRHENGELINRLDALPKSLFWSLFGVLLIILGLVAVWFVRGTIFHTLLPQTFPSLWVFWWGSFLAAFGVKLLTRSSWVGAFGLVLLIQGVSFATYGKLRLVSDFPFSLGYSETSRYYYGSLLFSKSLYRLQLPLSFLHPTRYFLLAIPYLFAGSSLQFARLWQAFLWVGLTAGSAFALVRRLHLSLLPSMLVAAWFYVYSFQGSIYYHLHVMVIIILLGVSARHPWRSLVAVLLASVWAGMSRINWFPAPAMLAIAIYLLEEPFDRYSNWLQYLKQPALWGLLGMLAAFLSQAYYIVWSGNASHPEFFSTSFSSALLWDRLLPGPTYPLGILLGISIVSLPLWLAIYFSIHGKLQAVHWLRWLGLSLLTIVLFVGGAIVSTKIGGGGDLHNMDAYMVILAVIASYFFANQVTTEKDAPFHWGEIPWAVIISAVSIPLLFSISYVTLYAPYSKAAVEGDLDKLRTIISDRAKNNGEILFITERQLLTYHSIPAISLVPEYEVVTLMEMAMSHNMDYLNRFYSDLHQHRFALIVARKQNTGIQPDEEGFADENNAWSMMIASPLLCEYQPVLTLESANVQVLAPRPGAHHCP